MKFLDYTHHKVLVVGDVMLDRYFWGQVDRISPESPVPVVNIKEKSFQLGGAGNVAANLAGLGVNTALLGCRGRDENGLQLSSLLKEKGIDDLIMAGDYCPTITKTRIMAKNQQLMRLDEEKNLVLDAERQEKILSKIKDNISAFGAIIVSDYGKGCCFPQLCQNLIKWAKENSIPVIIDPKGIDWTKYKGASCLTPNNLEFRRHLHLEQVSVQELSRLARKVCQDLELDRILITRGPEGVLLVGKETAPFYIPAQAKEVFDVSGAGDTVIAGLTAHYLSSGDWKEASKIANTAAGIVVSKLGTQPIYKEELQQQVNGSYGKVVSWQTAKNQIELWKRKGEKIVFTNGCFDLLHPGHIHLLHSAAEQGDRLVVGLNSDISVKKIKGKSRPILNQQDRSKLLSALECVDLVVLFEQETPIELICTLKPEILVKGADYRPEDVVGSEEIRKWGGSVALVPLLEEKSTTNVLDKIKKSFN